MPLVERAVPNHEARIDEQVLVPGGGMQSMIPKKRPTVPIVIPRKKLKKSKKIKKRTYRDISSNPRRNISENDSDDAPLLRRDSRKKSFKKRRHLKNAPRPRKIIPSDDSDNELILLDGQLNMSQKRRVESSEHKRITKSHKSYNAKSSDDSDDVLITSQPNALSTNSTGDVSDMNISGDRLQQKQALSKLLLSESSDDDLIVTNKHKSRLLNTPNDGQESSLRTKNAHLGGNNEALNNTSSSDEDIIISKQEVVGSPKISKKENSELSTTKLGQSDSDEELLIGGRSEGDKPSKQNSLRKHIEVASGSESDDEQLKLNGKHISEHNPQPTECFQNISKLGRVHVSDKHSTSSSLASSEDLTSQSAPKPVLDQSQRECQEEGISKSMENQAGSSQISVSEKRSANEFHKSVVDKAIPERQSANVFSKENEAMSISDQTIKESPLESSLKPQSDSDSDEPISILSKNRKEEVASSKSQVIDSSSDDEPISKPIKSKQKKATATKTKGSTKKKKSTKPKKVYDKPGQKKDTPGELNGARIFYETLREQIPDSKMAQEWLLKMGLLPYEEAKAIVEAQQKSKGKSSTSRNTVYKRKALKAPKKKSKFVDILSGESSSDETLVMNKKKETSLGRSNEDGGIAMTNGKKIISRASSFDQVASMSNKMSIPSGESSSDEDIITRRKKPANEFSSNITMPSKKENPFEDSSSDEDIIIAKS